MTLDDLEWPKRTLAEKIVLCIYALAFNFCIRRFTCLLIYISYQYVLRIKYNKLSSCSIMYVYAVTLATVRNY